MSRDDGFAVMDVSVDIVNDPKIRKLYRHAPEHAGAGFIAYIATMGESWKAGRRVTVEDAWPAFLPFDEAAVAALEHVDLIDSKGLVTTKAWRGWFTPAQTRRDAVRDRWRRHNAKRADSSTNDPGGSSAETASQPRGNGAVTATNHSVPYRTDPSRPDSDPLETGDSPPPPAKRGRRKNATNPRANGAAPRANGANPRANGTSTRQVRADQKRGPTQLGQVLRTAAEREQPDDVTPRWMQDPAEAKA